ncbi:copper resistance CopC family protein [Streptomyces sp. NPDC005811]|uniref:copper resistance CopC family protein n=1 Tax=Streptomyces sp. NPDC005811 TaxID=3154565 RepID=UPI0033DFEBEE
MHVLHRRAAFATARVLVVPAALAALTATAPQAAAHTELGTTSPKADATLAAPPAHVTLTFTDPMTQKYAKVAVTAADGTSAASGAVEVDGSTVTLPLTADVPSGRYTVGYRVVSADGHPVSGSYTFTVRSASTPGTTTSPPPKAVPTSAAARAEADQDSSGSAVLIGTGALVATGTAGLVLARRKRLRHDS